MSQFSTPNMTPILRADAVHDPHRPTYHYLPARNWMNDPNGLIYWQGVYHLFYQYNPNGAFHGTIHWGHAASRDLVHWEDLPSALAPSPHGADAEGCYSGCAIINKGVPTFVYTGIEPEVQCLATSTDDLITWDKLAVNPVIAAPPPELDVTGFRDPFVWQQDGMWYLVLGSGLKDIGGAILLYSSSDLITWEYRGPLLVGQQEATGTMWECPNFFSLGDRHMLIISVIPDGNVRYFIGEYREGQLIPEVTDVLDFGTSFYAPQTFLDAQGRRIMFGWLREERSRAAQIAAGWSGVQSLPIIIEERAGVLSLQPAPEIELLRAQHTPVDVSTLHGGLTVLSGIQSQTLEILATIDPTETGAITLLIRRSPDGNEETRISYDASLQQISVDRQRSAVNVDSEDLLVAPCQVPTQGLLSLRIFLDHSVIEVFAGVHAYLSARIYPTKADSLGLAILTTTGIRLHALDIWEMQVLWAE